MSNYIKHKNAWADSMFLKVLYETFLLENKAMTSYSRKNNDKKISEPRKTLG